MRPGLARLGCESGPESLLQRPDPRGADSFTWMVLHAVASVLLNECGDGLRQRVPGQGASFMAMPWPSTLAASALVCLRLARPGILLVGPRGGAGDRAWPSTGRGGPLRPVVDVTALAALHPRKAAAAVPMVQCPF